MRFTPKSELDQRIAKFQEKMRRQGIDGAILVQNADLFYFTGSIQLAHLFVPSKGQPVLMVKKSLERAQEESALDNVIPLGSLKNLKEVLSSYGYGAFDVLGFEMDVLPANLFLNYQKLVAPARIVDVSSLIREVRMIKSAYEIEVLRDVARLQNTMFDVTRENMREGITELELTGFVAADSRNRGHSGHLRVRGFNQDLFYLHLLSGKNTKPSYFFGSVGGEGVGPSYAQGSSAKAIQRNEPVLCDFSFVYDGYILDQTRVFCMGQLPSHLEEAHQTAMSIIKKIEQEAKPGVPWGDIYRWSVEMAEDSGFSDRFLGYPDQMAFVGHGIGIELDELPVLGKGFTTPLEEGMVFAVEPKFVFPEGAVGLENDYVVTNSGLEKLTVYEENIIYI